MVELDDWDLDGAPAHQTADQTADEAAGHTAGVVDGVVDVPPRLRFGTVEDFVGGFLTEVMWFDTTATNRIWCPQWWRHPTAIVRLEALHRAFEYLRQDPGLGVSTWLRDHADVHMAVLTDPQGPFKGCSVTKGHDPTRTRVIPTDPAPTGLFEEDD